MSRLKRILAAALVSALMMVMMATPAFAFIHVTIPADDCSGNLQAGENVTAQSALTERGAVFQGAQLLPIGNVTNAPTSCPAP